VEKAIDWDEKLPPEIQEKWASLFREILNLNDISFERRLTPPDAIDLPVLCVFSDASGEAFGTCAYVRWQLSNGELDVRFIAAKSRVAPLKRLTIPRLEFDDFVHYIFTHTNLRSLPARGQPSIICRLKPP